MALETPELHCFLYRSHIAPTADIACVADIVKTARNFNKTQGITGILVFDGQRFCQYIEGPQPALQQLIDNIAKDPRHTAFTPLHQACCEPQRRFGNWAMAYVLVDDEDEPLQMLEGIHGPTAIEKLQTLIPMLDMA